MTIKPIKLGRRAARTALQRCELTHTPAGPVGRVQTRAAKPAALPRGSIGPAGNWRVSFRVDGNPQPKGSWISMGRGRMRPDNPDAAAWETLCRLYGKQARAAAGLKAEDVGGRFPVSVSVLFILPRQPSHVAGGVAWTGGAALVASAPAVPALHGTGDADKLSRAVLDALETVFYDDDAQVIDLGPVCKRYGTSPGAEITVERMGGTV